MSFFDNQDKARRNTLVLFLLFLSAVALITLAVDFVGYLVVRTEQAGIDFPHWLATKQGLATSAASIGLIAIGSIARFAALADGGESVANMVGARPVDPSTREPSEQRLRNIVEEMAIASGVPMPRLYIMDQETSINAFVAGYEPNQAVLVVTHGALSELTRDELQGVIGHEFSHILNGDMRINVRLIAILAGILLIGQVGLFLVRSGGLRSGRSRGDRNNAAAIAVVGLALTLIGFIGVFFGRLIKAAISRQRERLADASSVQFTRNPEGLTGALYKIGIHGNTSLLQHTSHAEEMNHLCFGETITMMWSSLLASHPPIEDRIKAIDPSLLTRMRVRYGKAGAPRTGHGDTLPEDSLGFAGNGASFAEQPPSAKLSARVGTVTREAEDYARYLLSQLPPRFHGHLHTPSGAVQLCYALTLAEVPSNLRPGIREGLPQEGSLARDDGILDYQLQTLKQLGSNYRLPSLELALPALKRLPAPERVELTGLLREIVVCDGRINLFEFAVLNFVSKHLSPSAGRARRIRFRSYSAVKGDILTLLWLMSRAASDDATAAETLFKRTAVTFVNDPEIPDDKGVGAEALQRALQRLAALSPMLKPAVLDACGDCVLADGKVRSREYELLRLVADQLDCPMPPLPANPA
ncbi:M48 family metallopeptidase [Mangrovitalea sediminis]|uniref:M48 family metallopeptidase n=1 Tax=Mangrovitalea sediminis TaxID=1982043 RepID=UPI000BE59476|nr:M48 family metallopeptidase [Mangrovitalea sediminis]